MSNKVIDFAKIRKQKADAALAPLTEQTIDTLSDSDLLSFLKVCRYLRDLGYSKNATIRALEEDLFVDVEYYADIDENTYTDVGAVYKKTVAMDLLPVEHELYLSNQDAAAAVREMLINLDIKLDFADDE